MQKAANRNYPWFIVAMLWVVAFLNYFDRILITSMRDPIVADFKLTDAQFGLLTSVFLWSYGVLSPFGGYVADRYSRKKVIIFSILVWSVVTLWTGIAHTFHEMLLARLFMGVSEACYIPAALALIADYHQGKTRSLATGLHMSGLYTGLALGGLGGYIAEGLGWRYGFQAMGVFGVAYGLFLIFLVKDKPKTAEQTETAFEPQENISLGKSISKLLSVRSFLVLMFYFSIFSIINWLIYAWLPTFLKNQFHLDLGKAGLSATGYIQIGSFIGVIAGGLIADRWHTVNHRARILLVVIGFVVGAPFLFLMSVTSVFTIAIMALMVYGVARGFSDANMMPILCQVIDKRFIATGYGLLNFLSTISGGVMVYVGGVLMDARIGLSVIYKGSSIVMIIAVCTLLTVKLKPAENN